MSTLTEQCERAEQRWLESTEERELVERRIFAEPSSDKPVWTDIEQRARVMRRAERLGNLELTEAVISFDQPEAADLDTMERVIGKSQLEGVKFFEYGMIAARAVCRVLIRDPRSGVGGYGTGVLVGPGLLLTNNHVIGSASVATASSIQFDYLQTASGSLGETIDFELDPGRFFITDAELDFTLVATRTESRTGTLISDRGWCPLIAGSGKALKTERVNIIQHPGGEPMQIAVRDNTVIAAPGDFLHYRADTKQGSSGAPVFNSHWEMAALHHAGVPKRDAQRNIMTIDGTPWSGRDDDVDKIKWIANEGVRISSIVAHVKDVAMRPAQEALWLQAFKSPDPVNVWGLLANRRDLAAGHEGSTTGSNEQSPNVSFDAATGRTTWNFSLSFGPTGLDFDGVQGAAGPTAVATNADSAPTRAGIIGDGFADPSALAEAVLHRHRQVGQWYDEAADEEAKEVYWRDFDWSGSAADLYNRLNAHLKDTHKPLTDYYKARWHHLYAKVDVHEDKRLRNIYSGTSLTSVQAITQEVEFLSREAAARGFEATSLPDLERLIEDENFIDALERGGRATFNCEHVVCQSWFRDDPGVTSKLRKHMKCDLHHLFTCEWNCNSFRSNIPYFDFGPEDERIMQKCGRKEGNRFEPHHGKGLASRATMYFLLRYRGIVGDRRKEFTKSRLPVIINWHEQYEVTEFERHRNWLIEKAQGNRNPFVDFPDKVTKALLENGFG